MEMIDQDTFCAINLSSIDSKNSDLMHVGELGNHQNCHRERIQEKHWMMVVSSMRGNQVPAKN